MICKIVHGKVIFPPAVSGRMVNPGNDTDWLLAHGFRDMTVEEINAAKQTWKDAEARRASACPKKYSKLKIIRKLGDLWKNYEAMLIEKGLISQFNNADYLKSNDPVFRAVLANVPQELKAQLDDCLWDEK